MPGIIVSPTGREVPQKGQDDPNTKFQVYSRRTCTKGKHLPIIPTQDQPKSLRDGPKNIPGIPIPIPASIVPSNNKPIDLDVCMAIRKGVRSCTNHPIAKYLFYQKLSNNHRALPLRSLTCLFLEIFRKL